MALLLIAALVPTFPAASLAGPTPGQKCAVAKSKAAAKKFGAKLKCYQKAIGLGVTVDPACLSTAETKFDAAIAKAESSNGCVINGDGATIEATIDSCVDSIVNQTPGTTSTSTSITTSTSTITTSTSTSTTTSSSTSTFTTSTVPTCCSLPAHDVTVPPGITLHVAPGCGMADAPTCTLIGGSAVSGAFCRNDGTCGTATGPGPCCDKVGECYVLTAAQTSLACSLDAASYYSSAVCTAAGCQ